MCRNLSRSVSRGSIRVSTSCTTKGGFLEFDFVIAPGADPGQIRLAFDGIEDLQLDHVGNLLLKISGGEIALSKPELSQRFNGGERPVAGDFAFRDENELAFKIGRYDQEATLVIDPAFGFSTYLGGTDDEFNSRIAVGSDGGIYLTGTTRSTDFPVGPGSALGGTGDVFVTKLDPTGQQAIFSVFYGGSALEIAEGIAIDPLGRIYLVGETGSEDLPTTTDAFQTEFAGPPTLVPGQEPFHTADVFVAQFSEDGSTLEYGTYVGGEAFDRGLDIAIDAAGSAYISGWTSSQDFPTTPGVFQRAFAGSRSFFSEDVLVCKLNAEGTDLVYSTYLGGRGNQRARAIAVDGSGNAYVTGELGDGEFPTTPGTFKQELLDRLGDAFVTKLDAAGTEPLYSTLLGGSLEDVGLDIAADALGNAFAVGETGSKDFPTTEGAFQVNFGGEVREFPLFGGDGFLTKFNTQGSDLVFSSFRGGERHDGVTAIALQQDTGTAFVTGYTGSLDFPVTPDAFQGTFAGSMSDFNGDAFIARFNGTTGELIFAVSHTNLCTNSGSGSLPKQWYRAVM